MAIHIVIDGYNLIGNDKGLRGDLEVKREELIQRLKVYHERKGHPLTLVFDGWRSGKHDEMQQNRGSITVLFSRLGEKADRVIERLAREMGPRCVVVTSDREVRLHAETAGAAAIYAGEFRIKLEQTLSGSKEEKESAAVEPFASPRRVQKKGNPKKLSRIEKLRRERLKML